MASGTRTAGITALSIVTAIRGCLGVLGAGALLILGGAAGGGVGGAVAIVGLITGVLSFLLLFVAVGLWTGRWLGWVLGIVVFGLNSLLGLYQLQGVGLTTMDTVILGVDIVGLVYLVAVRNRFGSGSTDERSVPEAPHRR